MLQMSLVLGLAACAVSSVCFGSMYVAVRRFETGDGIFVQWIVCTGIFLVGMLVNAATNFPQFQPLAMLGGALWATGNLTALPIIKVVGLGMGILIWGSVNCVVGWASGRFGLFGIKANVPESPILNYIGLFLVIIGGVLFSLVKPSVRQERHEEAPPRLEDPAEAENSNLMGYGEVSAAGDVQRRDESPSRITARSNKKRIGYVPLGCLTVHLLFSKAYLSAIVASAFAGVCYGLTFVPVIYIQDNPAEFKDPPTDAVAYAFSHFSGIFLTSSLVLIVYLAFTNNNPFVNGKIIAPALFAGLLWGIAQLAWFAANDLLSQAITFPINAMLPGVVAALWSVFYFKEIEGEQNLRLLAVAVAVTLTGASIVGISKSI